MPSQRRFLRPMRARDRGESHRVSTPLELLFDLCFVAAIAPAAAGLHHALAAGHVGAGVRGYAMVFFAIWWAWVNFTWYASAYDNDDLVYRLTALVVIAGVLVMAAGIPGAFERGDFTVPTAGYTVMRVGLVFGWLRASRADNEHKRTARRYALALFVVQAAWVALIFGRPSWWPVGFAVLGVTDLFVPSWAERVGSTTWHAGHIAERYGLMTILVLGESILSTSFAIQRGLGAGVSTYHLAGVAVGGLLIVFAMWWIYFDQSAHHFLRSNRVAFYWGYGHYAIFASCAAVGAGLAAAADAVEGHTWLPWWAQGAPVAVPVAIYVTFVWTLQVRPLRCGYWVSGAFALAPPAVLACAALPCAVLMIGLVLTALVAVTVLAPRTSRLA